MQWWDQDSKGQDQHQDSNLQDQLAKTKAIGLKTRPRPIQYLKVRPRLNKTVTLLTFKTNEQNREDTNN